MSFMPPRHILSPQSRAALFDPPTDSAAIVRHYTFSSEDLALIRERRRAANRLGFGVHLAFLRFPGRVIGVDEAPPPTMLAFIAAQLGDDAKTFKDYAQRQQTRRAHLGELQAYLALRPFGATTSALLSMSRSTKRPDRIAATSSCPR